VIVESNSNRSGLLVVLPQPGAAVVVICLCTWAFLEAIGGNLQFVYPSELFPTSLRAAGVGTAAAISRIGAAIGTFAFPVVLSAYGVQVVMFRALSLLVLGALASQKYAPETSNRGLQEEGPGPVREPALGGMAQAG
jgi:putative MFS transporter